MKKFLTYRLILFCVVLLSSILYLLLLKSDTIPGFANNADGNTSQNDEDLSGDEKPSDPDSDTSTDLHTEPENTLTPTPTIPPNLPADTLNVRGALISLGDSKKSVIKQLGHPGRIDETEYDFDYYVYNNDYNKLVYIAIKSGKVMGFYTDSLDFYFHGISSGTTLDTINDELTKNYSLNSVLIYETDSYTLKILLDTLETKTTVGIYVLSHHVKEDAYTDSVKRNVELMVYDLTNSARVRSGAPVLSWSSSVAVAARRHSTDMAAKGFFDHMNQSWETPSDRLMDEGVLCNTVGENLIGGYGTAILSNHGWFISKDHRKNMLSKNFRYLGVGFEFNKESNYKTYITQNYYR
ncbi:MAG: hypothetical protein K0S76_1851 [Herbinix sp.]|jgi:uncharacterized protein YkwD|nr:hypothetical protein [Herbinix sp.]